MSSKLLPLILFFTLQAYSVCNAEEIDLKKIAIIESSNNPNAYNPRSGASGLYGITKICLEDYNKNKFLLDSSYKMGDMFNTYRCRYVAEWYLFERIPGMLKHFGFPPTVENILISYNAGIKFVVEQKDLPQETIDYIKKYRELEVR